MTKRKILGLLLAGVMALSLVACGTKEVAEEPVEETPVAEELVEETPAEPELEDVTVRVGAMSGPTAMGMVKLMDDARNGASEISYEFAELATEASAFVAPLAKGELDIACVPANLASVIYNNTEGKVTVLATCNEGVLYVVERGETINGPRDLEGKTVYMTGQGAVPEYTFRYLLKAWDIDPDTGITINWCADTTEALSYIAKDENAIAVLPQPFVTAACAQVEGLRVALDLNAQWKLLSSTNSSIVTGVVVARKEFVEANPNTVAKFIEDYAASVDYVNNNVEEASTLIEEFGIVAKAAVAQKALPGCNLVCYTGNELKTALGGFLNVLFEQNPQSVGGNLPADDFYYGAD